MNDQEKIKVLEAKLKESYATIKRERVTLDNMIQQVSKDRFLVDKDKEDIEKRSHDIDVYQQKLDKERTKERLVLLARWAELHFDGAPPKHLANDFAYLSEMFDRAGVAYTVDADINAMTRTLTVDGGPNSGYGGFFCEHTFDEKGNLTEVGVWE